MTSCSTYKVVGTAAHFSFIAPILCLSMVACQSAHHPSSNSGEEAILMPTLNPTDGESLGDYAHEGPFEIRQVEDVMLRIAPQLSIECYMVYPSTNGSSPIVILQHGNLSSATDHLRQAKHIASWGYSVMAPSLPNHGQWDKNAAVLKTLTEFVQSWPKALHPNADGQNIFLVGHSFGGYASSQAVLNGAPVSGLVLLDPALYAPLKGTRSRNPHIPVVILGADQRVFRSKGRKAFYRIFRDSAIEVSLRDTDHFDAQWPQGQGLLSWLREDRESQRLGFSAAVIAALMAFQNQQPRLSLLPLLQRARRKKLLSGKIKFKRDLQLKAYVNSEQISR